MKKRMIQGFFIERNILVLFIVLFFVFLLNGCVGEQTFNLEEIMNYRAISYQMSDMERIDLHFEDGTLTVEVLVYDVCSWSPSGKLKNDKKSSTYTFEYVLEGDNYITIIGDQKYYYYIDEDGIHFSVAFLGIAKDW